MVRTIYFCLTILACAATALGQQTSTTQAQQDDRLSVGTNLVTVRDLFLKTFAVSCSYILLSGVFADELNGERGVSGREYVLQL
jgi:hypothetical protein